MTLISYLTQKRQPLFFRSAPPPYSYKGFDKLSFKKKAFTLAEVLITLTIIGVVAAMTIPTLMAKYQKQTYVTGLKKGYSVLMNAVKILPLSVGCPSEDYDCSGFSFELLIENLKVSKSCYGNLKDCLGENFATYPTMGSSVGNFITLADGMLLSQYGGINYLLDVNGLKGPNKYGRDIFIFEEIQDGFTSYGGLKPETSNGSWESTCTTENVDSYSHYITTLGCTARVLEENAMNY